MEHFEKNRQYSGLLLLITAIIELSSKKLADFSRQVTSTIERNFFHKTQKLHL